MKATTIRDMYERDILGITSEVALDKRVIDMTASEFTHVLSQAFKAAQHQIRAEEEREPKVADKYVYNITGLMELFGCSRTTAAKIYHSGVINDAITPTGERTFACHAEQAMELLRKHKENKRKGINK